MANLINSNAPNVVEFQKRGGKLIIIHNTADMAVSPVATMNSKKDVGVASRCAVTFAPRHGCRGAYKVRVPRVDGQGFGIDIVGASWRSFAVGVNVILNPYLSFNGNCEEAFRLYERVLGGNITYIGRYKDMPGDHGLPPDSVMHVTLVVGDQTLQGADSPPSQYQTPKGTAVALQIKNIEEAERVFAGLSQGGSVDMPLQETFWAARFAMFRDRFGTPWMLNSDKPA